MKILLSLIFYSFYLLFPLIVFLLSHLYLQENKSIEIFFLLIITLILLWSRFIEPNIFLVKNYNFLAQENPQENLKVAVFSDLHVGVFTDHNKVKKIVKKVNDLSPDLVLIPGDFVYFASLNKLDKYLKELKNIKAPTLAVLGNHDYGKREKDMSLKIKASLESWGVMVIDNQVQELKIKGRQVKLLGLADIWTAKPDYSILKNISGEEDLSLLLAHNPDTVYEILANFPEAKKADLIISGHTHAGQIRIPWIYKKIIPSDYDFDKGFYHLEDYNLFVNPGIGTVLLPLRLFNFPEISLLNIDF